jgi:general secretion pathway protein D
MNVKREESGVKGTTVMKRTLAIRYLLPAVCCLLAVACTMPEVQLGDQLAAKGDWEGAVSAYRDALKKGPFNEDVKQRLKQAKVRAAELHYAEGRKHLKESRVPEAVHAFKQALSLDPTRKEYQAVVSDAFRLKEARDQLLAADKLKTLGRLNEALAAYEQAVQLDPDLTLALDGITAVTEQQKGESAFGGSTQPVTLRFQNAKLKEVFEILARAGGLNVILDKEVKDDPITIFIKDTLFPDALNLILSTNGLFAKRIGPDTLLVSPNTKPKQDQYQDLLIRTFYFSNAKAKDMVNLLRTMLESKRVYVNEPINAVVIRDTPDKLQLAERIILANDRRESEVELDLEVLEVNRTDSKKYGLNFAKSAGAALVPPGFVGTLAASANQFTYRQLLSLGPDSYLFSLPVSVVLDFFKNETDTKTLASPKLRVLNNRQASVNIGDKQPILLSTTNVLPGQAATGAVPTTSTVTSIEFKDVGVKLTVEPTIHLLDELTLKLKIEVTRVGDQVTLQASPEIKQFRFGTRTAETVLNMRDGEAVILAGLIQDEERKTRVTVPGLGDIPVLGHLFSSVTTDTITTEVVLTITPRIVRNVNVPGVDTQAFWSGTEGNYSATPLFPEVRKTSFKSSVPAPASAQAPAAGATPAQPNVQAPAAGTPAQPTPAPPVTPGGPAPQPPISQQGGGVVVAGGAAILAIRPPELSAFAGQEFAVELLADNIESFAESSVTVSYDPKVLEFQRALEGEFLTRNGTPASITIVSATPTAGQITFRLQRGGEPVAGSGVLAMVFFKGKAAGSSAVEIQNPTVSGTGAKPIPVTVKRGQITVK